MVSYDIWCDLKDSSRDLEFVARVEAYLGSLRDQGLLTGFRVRRRMLGLGPKEFGEFNVTIDFDNLSQVDRVFGAVAARSGEVEGLHAKVYSSVKNLTFGLSRDFPADERANG